MKFVDRKDELARLQRLADLDDGGLAVIWGRRRVGKTRLLLGEVRWRDREADPRFVERAAADLLRKGRPRNKSWAELETVHALFVPRLARGLRKQRLPVTVIEAREVVQALA